MFYQVKEGGYSRLTKYGNYLVWPVEMMMMIKMTCQNNWMASRARGTTERRKPEKISIESFSRLSQENVSKLNFMNHGILCFPSWDSSIPESRLCIESFLFPIYPLWSCLANEELSSNSSQPCKYFGIQRYFVWAQQTTPDKPWNPFEISTTTRNCLKLHLSWIPRHKCKFALLGKLSSHSLFLFSLGWESDLFFLKLVTFGFQLSSSFIPYSNAVFTSLGRGLKMNSIPHTQRK